MSLWVYLFSVDIGALSIGLSQISSLSSFSINDCIHVKLEKFKRGTPPSLHLAKE